MTRLMGASLALLLSAFGCSASVETTDGVAVENDLTGSADPWDPKSCEGEAISVDELRARLGDNASLGRWSTAVRHRDCSTPYGQDTTCTAWSEGGGNDEHALASASDLTGRAFIREAVPNAVTPEYVIRLESDTVCRDGSWSTGGYGATVITTHWGSPVGLRVGVTKLTSPMEWHGSKCVAGELPLSRRDVEAQRVTDHCLRLPLDGQTNWYTGSSSNYREFQAVVTARY